MSGLRPILLAEDNANDVELTLSALESAHLANPVVIARDGVEALDYLFHRGKFAGQTCPLPVVVFLDLTMPRVDGREVLRQVRAEPALSPVPIVMLTSSREEIDLVESYRLRVNAYVVKPVGFDAFVGTVAKLGVFWALLNEPPPPLSPA